MIQSFLSLFVSMPIVVIVVCEEGEFSYTFTCSCLDQSYGDYGITYLFFLNRVNDILGDVKVELDRSSFVVHFKVSKLRDVLEKLRELTEQLVSELKSDCLVLGFKNCFGVMLNKIWCNFGVACSDLRVL